MYHQWGWERLGTINGRWDILCTIIGGWDKAVYHQWGLDRLCTVNGAMIDCVPSMGLG